MKSRGNWINSRWLKASKLFNFFDLYYSISAHNSIWYVCKLICQWSCLCLSPWWPGKGSCLSGSSHTATSLWWLWSWPSCSGIFSSYEFSILKVSSLGPSLSSYLKLLKVSEVTSPNTIFFRSMKGHGDSVMANLLLLVFY